MFFHNEPSTFRPISFMVVYSSVPAIRETKIAWKLIKSSLNTLQEGNYFEVFNKFPTIFFILTDFSEFFWKTEGKFRASTAFVLTLFLTVWWLFETFMCNNNMLLHNINVIQSRIIVSFYEHLKYKQTFKSILTIFSC